MNLTRSFWLFVALSGMSLSVGAVDVKAEVLLSSSSNLKQAKKRTNKSLWKDHHYEVFYVNGRVARVLYIRNSDNKILIESHPGGIQSDHKIDKKVSLSVQKFHKEIRRYIKRHEKRIILKPNKVSPAAMPGAGIMAAGAAQSEDGIGLGYDGSVGYLGPQSQCYNFSTILSSPVTNVSLTESQGTDSFADQWNASASISGKSAMFSAKATATLGGNWERSSYSGSMFFNGSVVYNAHNSFQGLNGDFLVGLCGSEFVADIPVGMLVTSQFSWSSSNQTASNSVAASLSGTGGGLTKISAAVQAAYSSANSNSNTSFNFVYTVIGGDSQATADVALAYNTYQTNLNACETQGSVTDCNTFANGFGGGVAQALSGYQSYLETAPHTSSNGIPSGLASLGEFPEGIAGVSLPYEIITVPLTTLMTSGNYPDALQGYQGVINNYIGIMNQISSLYNRAQHLINALSLNSYNPIPMWDLSSDIVYVGNTYLGDLNAMQENLNTCMSSQNNAEIDCAALSNIYNAGINNAYEWYSNSGLNPNNTSSFDRLAAQQNSISLQYTAVFQDTNGTFPMDVVWVNQTPTSWYVAPNYTGWYPNGVPALVGFADQPWFYKQWYTMASVHFYTPGVGGNITSAMSSWMPYVFNLNNSAWGYGNGWGTTLALSGEGVNTFSQPAALSMFTQASYQQSVVFSPINNFFE